MQLSCFISLHPKLAVPLGPRGPLSLCKGQTAHTLVYTVTFPSSVFCLLLFFKG